MNPKERRQLKQQADSFEEMLAYACGEDPSAGPRLEERVNVLEEFFETHGFSRAKPRKMAVTYVLTREGYNARGVAKWWGDTDSNYWSVSADSARGYMEDIRDLVNEHPDADSDGEWTDGDLVYDPNADPLQTFYDVEVETRNAKLGSFGD